MKLTDPKALVLAFVALLAGLGTAIQAGYVYEAFFFVLNAVIMCMLGYYAYQKAKALDQCRAEREECMKVSAKLEADYQSVRKSVALLTKIVQADRREYPLELDDVLPDVTEDEEEHAEYMKRVVQSRRANGGR